MSQRHWAMLMLVLSQAISSRAFACGGCFAPPQTSASEVVGHRMVFAISDQRTVLWDQFEYTGSPEEFSWVRPIKPGAYVEQAEQAWFDALDAATRRTVTAPSMACNGSDVGGCGCGNLNPQPNAPAAELASDGPSSVHVVG